MVGLVAGYVLAWEGGRSRCTARSPRRPSRTCVRVGPLASRDRVGPSAAGRPRCDVSPGVASESHPSGESGPCPLGGDSRVAAVSTRCDSDTAARHGLGPTRSRTRGWPDTIARATRATWSWRGGGCSESDHLPRLNVSCQHAQQLPPVVHHHPYRRLEGVLDRGQGLSRRRRRDSLIFNKGVVMSRPKASSRRPEADVPALDCSLLGIRFVTKLLEHWIW